MVLTFIMMIRQCHAFNASGRRISFALTHHHRCWHLQSARCRRTQQSLFDRRTDRRQQFSNGPLSLPRIAPNDPTPTRNVVDPLESKEFPTTNTTTQKFRVTAPFDPTGDQPAAINELLRQLGQHSQKAAVLRGITGTGKTLVMSHVIAGLQKPTLVLCHNKNLAAQLAREFNNYLGPSAVELFVSYYDLFVPESFGETTGRYVQKKSVINQDIDALRHRATRSLVTRNDVVVVATVSAIYGLGLPQEYLTASVQWEVGQAIRGLLEPLNAMLYQEVDLDENFEPGTYQHESFGFDERLRRHKISLWPPHERFPVTITADEHQSTQGDGTTFVIQSLQQGTLKGLRSTQSLRIFPARHHVTPSDRLEDACRAIEEELKQRTAELTAQGNRDAAARLQERVLGDVYMMREVGFCKGMENYSRHLNGRQAGQAPETLLDYFSSQFEKEDWLLVVDESHVTLPQLKAMYAGDQSRKKSLIKHGYRLPSALDNRPLKENEFWKQVRQTLFVSATPANYELEQLELSSAGIMHEPVDMVIRPTMIPDPPIEIRSPSLLRQNASNPMKDMATEICQRIARNERGLVMTLTKRDAEDLASYLNSYSDDDPDVAKVDHETRQIKATYLHSGLKTDERSDRLRMLQTGEVDVVVGVNCLREGLDLPEVSLVVVLGADSEGFLRSETALLQIVGRAARNRNGRAIFYAERETLSMKKCIQETNKRREKQLEHNILYGYEPQSTKGSSTMTFFDLLRDEIEAEQHLQFSGVGSDTASTELSTTTVPLTGDRNKRSDIPTDHIPGLPGVYFWKDGDGRILYIGKAVKLRARINSYLTSSAKHGKRIKAMVEKAATVEFIVTPSERDALVLESNLIKKHKPPFNVLLKDDVHYPYIRASVEEKLPRLSIVPYRPPGEESKSRYFGPYTSFSEIKEVLDRVEETYDLRVKSLEARHGSGSVEEYNELFQRAMNDVFSSKSKAELKELRDSFEEAGLLFDSPYNSCRDVVVVTSVEGQDSEILVHVAQLRNGYVAGQFSYGCSIPHSDGDDRETAMAEAIQMVLEQRHYSFGGEIMESWFPDKILTKLELPNPKSLRETIRAVRKEVEPTRKGSITIQSQAKRGPRQLVDSRALEFAESNAIQALQERHQNPFPVLKTSVDGTATKELAELLKLHEAPSVIECYDISHTQGKSTVASRVVFKEGQPVPDLYRRFNIRTVEGIDDYASLAEVLERRFKRALPGCDDAWAVPDLVVIDGGKGQLSAAQQGIARVQDTMQIPICALAKNHEELFVPGSPEPVNDSSDSPAMLLLRHLRDESHRFALKTHRRQRQRSSFAR